MLGEFRERKRELTQALEALRAAATRIGAESLALRLKQQVADKLESETFHLVVVGEFNHGKSALLNALLGSDVMPVGVTPTTALIHHLVHGPQPTAELVLESGERRPVPFDRIADFSVAGSRANEAARYLEVRYPAELLRDRVVLVDTPGVNDLSLTRSEITFGYIPNADAVLFVLDAGQPVKESEREFLQHKLIGQSRDRIVFVVNKADIWTTEERQEALAYVRERLGGMLDGAPVFAVSSLSRAQSGQALDDFGALREHLARILTEERGSLLLRHATAEGLAAASLLERAAEARRSAADLTTAELERRIELLTQDLAGHAGTLEERRLMIREETAAVKAWVRRDLDRFCEDTLDRLPAMLEGVTASDVQAHLAPFLEHALRLWAEAETEEIARSLTHLAEHTATLLRDDARVVSNQLAATMGHALEPPNLEVDTFMYDMGVLAVLSLGLGVVFANALVGGVLLAAAPALALYTRDRTEMMVRSRAREVTAVVLRDAAAQIAPRLDEMLEGFRDRLETWVMEAGREVYRDLMEVLQQTRALRSTDATDAAEERARCDQVAEQVRRWRGQLEEWARAMSDQAVPHRVPSSEGDRS